LKPPPAQRLRGAHPHLLFSIAWLLRAAHSWRTVISVADTGIGMTEEQINRLGTPYYSTKDKGTGLGTMVSFSIIKKMGGTITIKSEPGKGTVYHISFPLHQ
jgi:two-component system sporulation sensor kinase B